MGCRGILSLLKKIQRYGVIGISTENGVVGFKTKEDANNIEDKDLVGKYVFRVLLFEHFLT